MHRGAIEQQPYENINPHFAFNQTLSSKGNYTLQRQSKTVLTGTTGGR